MKIRLAAVPHFANREYHPDQVAFYSKFTDLVFKALKLPSVSKFLEGFAEEICLGNVEVRISRMPSSRSRVYLSKSEGGLQIVKEELKGISIKERGFIHLFPDLIWPNRMMRPIGSVGVRGFVLNSSIRGLIHEMIHLSGIRDEDETRKLTDRYYKAFRRTHIGRFDEEFKPLLKEWKSA